MAEKYSDKELLEQFKSKDSQHFAFNTIVRKHQEKLYWHIRRMVLDHDDADDILQNTWIKTWKGLNKFRSDANLYTWLYRIAPNETITFLNNKKKRFFVPIGDVEHELASDFESDNTFTGDQIQRKLQQAILTLPEKQRLVFNMKYFEEMKYTQMSEILDTSVGALKASYHHAIKKIEQKLKQD